MDSERELPEWQQGDALSAVRLNMMQHLAQSAQLVSGGSNVRLYKGAQGQTAITVDQIPIPPRYVELVYPASTGPSEGVFYPGGIYAGSVWQQTNPTIDVTAPVTYQMLGATGAACWIVNLDEEGTDRHDLDGIDPAPAPGAPGVPFPPILFIGLYRGRAADGFPVYAINGFQAKLCTPPESP